MQNYDSMLPIFPALLKFFYLSRTFVYFLTRTQEARARRGRNESKSRKGVKDGAYSMHCEKHEPPYFTESYIELSFFPLAHSTISYVNNLGLHLL